MLLVTTSCIKIGYRCCVTSFEGLANEKKTYDDRLSRGDHGARCVIITNKKPQAKGWEKFESPGTSPFSIRGKSGMLLFEGVDLQLNSDSDTMTEKEDSIFKIG